MRTASAPSEPRRTFAVRLLYPQGLTSQPRGASPRVTCSPMAFRRCWLATPGSWRTRPSSARAADAPRPNALHLPLVQERVRWCSPASNCCALRAVCAELIGARYPMEVLARTRSRRLTSRPAEPQPASNLAAPPYSRHPGISGRCMARAGPSPKPRPTTGRAQDEGADARHRPSTGHRDAPPRTLSGRRRTSAAPCQPLGRQGADMVTSTPHMKAILARSSP